MATRTATAIVQVARDLVRLKHRPGTPERRESERRIMEADARYFEARSSRPVTKRVARIKDADNPRIRAIRKAGIEYKGARYSLPVALPPDTAS